MSGRAFERLNDGAQNYRTNSVVTPSLCLPFTLWLPRLTSTEYTEYTRSIRTRTLARAAGEEFMLLTPREQEKLLIYVAAELARKRRGRGLKLNVAEATALIVEALLEGARDGRSVAELMELGRHVVSREDVMDAVPAMLPVVQVEATFPDGTKLISCHDPII